MKSATHLLLITLTAVLAITIISFGSQDHAAALFSGATGQACSGASLQSNGACTDSSSSITTLIKAVILVISWIVGIVSIIMVIFGGFRYVTSGGDSAATASARNTIIYALVGLVIAVLAQTLVYFVFTRAYHATSSTGTVLYSQFV
jgi:hypothetical protein